MVWLLSRLFLGYLLLKKTLGGAQWFVRSRMVGRKRVMGPVSSPRKRPNPAKDVLWLRVPRDAQRDYRELATEKRVA